MKKTIGLFLCVLLTMATIKPVEGQSVSAWSAGFQALKFWNIHPADGSGLVIEPLNHHDTATAWLVQHPDRGFVVVSIDSMLRPVLAWGERLTDLDPERLAGWKTLLAADYNGRLEGVFSGTIATEKHFWQHNPGTPFQQWPPDGTTPTGGWLYTNWTQTSPYNKLCPLDLNAGARSVVGCPATAMAQIFNFNRSLNFTRFDDSDDYYHSYGAGNQYWIDDDYEIRKFPPFAELNDWLDTLETCYNQGLAITDSMKAALSFAAGVAAHQVYTASVSGTFGIDQAHMAILRFGFDQAELLLPPDPTINARVAADMMNAMPVQLGLVDAANTVGHNVVVDGYNTDEFFHFNFGWGGSANGWYTLPPTSIPYNLTVIEGVVVQIRSTFASVDPPAAATSAVMFSSAGKDQVSIINLSPGQQYKFQLLSITGGRLFETSFVAGESRHVVETTGLARGVYVCRLISENQQITGKVVL